MRRSIARGARRRGERDDHGRWLVSYADFITLLFAFFVVMYAISQINESKYRVLSDALLKVFKPNRGSARVAPPSPRQPAPTVPENGDGLGPAEQRLRAVAQDVINALDPMVKSGQVRVTESGRGVAVDINASALFASGEAEIQTQALPALEGLAQVLVPLPNDIEIEGHTDTTPIASARYPSNWELSSARASSVVRLLNNRGVASVRLVAVGYADTRNVSPNITPEGRAQNRRVTVMILPEGMRRVPLPPSSPAPP